ncbi:MAG: glycyl-radical enzyme activating protein [Mogibacterium sp.]|nr:glycyl-radical enzyme activating protein [Mogibacterium sp.]
MESPLVLELKGNSLDDGPGIRTAVFFKGCPLSCIWCHNPESKHVEAELSVSLADCIGCGTCRSVCPQGAADPAKPGIVDRTKCVRCFTCAQNCPPKAIQRVGVQMSMDEIVQKCAADKPFYDVSGGGVTLTGGEPTMFTDWTGELAKRLTEAGMCVHIETSGMFNYEKVREKLLPFVSSIYMDVKIFDRETHKKYCGIYNDVILENFRRLVADSAEMGFSFLPRTPLIPDITDTDENLGAIAGLYKETGVKRTELLPYNPTWYGKTEKLGVGLAKELAGVRSWQSNEKMEHCKDIFRSEGIEC